jgi:hypothetical protein
MTERGKRYEGESGVRCNARRCDSYQRERTLAWELKFEGEPCVPGWRLVKDFDAYALDREIRKTGWTFFCLAREIKATVFGMDRQKMKCRAIERIILASTKSEKFNALEITRVASVGSVRFPLVRYLTISCASPKLCPTVNSIT